MKDWKPKQNIPKKPKVYARDCFASMNSGDVFMYSYSDGNYSYDFIGVVLERIPPNLTMGYRYEGTYHLQDIFSFKDGIINSTYKISYESTSFELKKFLFTLPDMRTKASDIMSRVKSLYPEYVI